MFGLGRVCLERVDLDEVVSEVRREVVGREPGVNEEREPNEETELKKAGRQRWRSVREVTVVSEVRSWLRRRRRSSAPCPMMAVNFCRC